MPDDAAEEILNALEAAGAVAGHEPFLTPDEIAAETGLDRATVAACSPGSGSRTSSS